VASGATFLATVISVPLFSLVQGRAPGDPTQLAMIFAMTLLGSWGVMIPAKIWETRPVSKGTRRLTGLGVGGLIGLAGAGLSLWAHLGMPGRYVEGPAAELVDFAGSRMSPEGVVASTMASYFALVFAIGGLWKLATRERIARFRVWPLFGAAIVAGLVGAFVPSPQPWGTIVFALIAAVTQISSPWSREAAAYARYEKAVGDRAPKLA
jgi:hypothetical protein